MADGASRHESEAEAARDHRQDPIVALAAVCGLAGEPVLLPERAGIAVELAIDAVEVAQALEVSRPDAVLRRERVLGREHDQELLAIERHIVQPLVLLVRRRAVDCHLEVALDQPPLQLLRARIHDLELDAGVAALNRADEVDELVRRDGAHDPELEHCLFEVDEVERLALGLARLLVDLLQIRLHHPPELGQVRVRPLAVEQRSAELALEKLDRPRQRRRMGDQYLRRLLVTGMTSLVRRNKHHPDSADPRINALLARKPLRLVTVAMANRAARAIWAIMVRGDVYRVPALGSVTA